MKSDRELGFVRMVSSQDSKDTGVESSYLDSKRPWNTAASDDNPNIVFTSSNPYGLRQIKLRSHDEYFYVTKIALDAFVEDEYHQVSIFNTGFSGQSGEIKVLSVDVNSKSFRIRILNWDGQNFGDGFDFNCDLMFQVDIVSSIEYVVQDQIVETTKPQNQTEIIQTCQCCSQVAIRLQKLEDENQILLQTLQQLTSLVQHQNDTIAQIKNDQRQFQAFMMMKK